MDINDILIDGKLDAGHLKSLWSGYDGYFVDFFDELAEAINAHIATLNQSTPITPELLERAGFILRYNARMGIKFWEKGKISFGFVTGGYIEDIPVNPKTMEQLSTIYECHTGQPLNWQHDPAAEVRKRLEAMGFKSNAGNNYRLSLGDADIDFIVEFDSSLVLSVWLGRMSRNKSGIKTIDALERVIKELKGE